VTGVLFIGCCASRPPANRLRWSDLSSDPISAIFVEEIRCPLANFVNARSVSVNGKSKPDNPRSEIFNFPRDFDNFVPFPRNSSPHLDF
jgi:hypothetical protein